MHAQPFTASGSPLETAAGPTPETGWLDRLNPEQRQAATWGGPVPGGVDAGPLLVIAGAGTGKTATLAHRVAWLVLQGVDPARILLLTFSRRAAEEMIRRAERLVAEARESTRRVVAAAGVVSAAGVGVGVGGVGGGPAAAAARLSWSGTFHAIGARLLRQHAERLGLDPSFGILDRGDAADLIDVVRHDLGLSAKARRFPRKDTCLAIYSYRVNAGWPLERVLAEAFPWCAEWHDDLRALFRAYVERKLEHGVLDYDDLLLWWHEAMIDPALAAEIGSGFDQVLVDEFQDTNALQDRILAALKPDGRGVTVVGDDAQSIYSFRAADVDNILRFPQRFDPPAGQVMLTRNYRSVQPVLDAANMLIADAKRQVPKSLTAVRGNGAKPRLVIVADEREQCDWVVGQVLARREEGVPLKQQAVLFRSGHHSDALEVELARRNIPFVKYGGLKFLESTHIKDVLAVLRWADNPKHGIAAFRVLQLQDGIGPALARRCFEQVQAAGGELTALAAFAAPDAASQSWPGFCALMQALARPAADWAGQLEQVTGWYQPLLEQRYDDALVRAADLDMLVALAPRFDSRERFLTELTLDPPSASGDLSGEPLRDEDYLILSTVHSSKGQEWDCVTVLNVTDGNFPNEFSTGSEAGLEEERRLLYVAMTRAKNRLDLIEPQNFFVTQQPKFGDRHVRAARSRFMTKAVRQCLQAVGPQAGDAQGRRQAATTNRAPIDVAARLRGMW